jgi:homoserine dehydrogenase
VPRSHLLSQVRGAFNAVCLRGRALGTSLYYGQGAGMMPTATAVVADIVDAARNMRAAAANAAGTLVPSYGRAVGGLRTARVIPMAATSHEHYIRLSVADKPGVLARISSILGKESISIATVAQHENPRRGVVPLVLRTHRAEEAAMNRALARIARLSIVRGRPVVIRVEEALGQGGGD